VRDVHRVERPPEHADPFHQRAVYGRPGWVH
jgi:hypothetical protein